MRNRRRVIINLVETNNVNNARLIEYLANKFKERGIENGREQSGYDFREVL